MNTAFYIAKRYLFAKKSTNAINIISAISALGVFVGSAALIIILSVFNGFEGMVVKIVNTVTPEIIITAKKGKTFNPNTTYFNALKNNPKIYAYTQVLAENALLMYNGKQAPALIKGVSPDFLKNKRLDSIVVEGKFMLTNSAGALAVIGSALQMYLGVNTTDPFNQLQIYSPKKGLKQSLTSEINPLNDFTVMQITPAGVFEIQQDFDNLAIVPLSFARQLLGEPTKISAIEINVKNGINSEVLKQEITAKIGANFLVKNRIEQNQALFNVLGSEKWMVYIILTFILIIAIFNIIGSLTMLVIEKLKDIAILSSLGAGKKLISNIFLLEGLIISLLGCLAGLLIGLIFCLLQQHYGLVKMSQDVVDMPNAYPISLKWKDFLLVFITVSGFSFIASGLAAKLSVKKIEQLNQDL